MMLTVGSNGVFFNGDICTLDPRRKSPPFISYLEWSIHL
jgi:hypothetical protein